MLSNHFRAQEFLEKINKPPLWAQALNVAGEAGEFAEAYRRYTGNARRVSDSNEVMEELADVVISAYVFAELFGHSLDTAIFQQVVRHFERGYGNQSRPA